MIKDRAFPLQTPSVSDEVQQIGNPAERLLQRIFEEKVITEQARVEQGTVQAAPKPSTSHEKFTGTVYVFTKDEGGLRKPFCTGDKFQLHFRTNDEIGTLTLPAGTEKLMPGDNSELEVELLSPVAIKEGMRFAILKGDRTIGVGTISKIIK
ncbi:MAG: hypothetical protein Q8L98_07350 [Chlamydiales bacterium]|nr:hypothetical protein [Chlamydiales bacterium]